MLFLIINHLMHSKIMKYLMINFLMMRSRKRRRRMMMKKITMITMMMMIKKTNTMTKKLKLIKAPKIKIDIIHLCYKLTMTVSNLNKKSISILITTIT